MRRRRQRGFASLERVEPALSFGRFSDADSIRIVAYENGEPAGEVRLGKDVVPRSLVVHTIFVGRDSRNERIGTRLYERALREACERGEQLVSDSMRSRYAEAFWRKQARKRRAVCLEKGRATVYDSPMRELFAKLLIDCRRTHYSKASACAKARFKAMTAHLPAPREVTEDSFGIWPCYRWGFRSDACGSSLEGLPGPSRKKALRPLLLGALFVLPLIPP